MEPRHLVVVGAGISGLAAAWSAWLAAEATGRPLRITVLEAGRSAGGKAQSTQHDGGWLTEGGPTGFLDNEPVLDRLVQLAGLEKVPAPDAAAHRFVVRGGKLREIHSHPLRFATSGILSPLGLLRVLRERWVPGKVGDVDESVWEFGRRRLGAQAADRLLSPMVQGVFAGDAKAISLPAAFPKMAELELEYGSLFKALGAKRRAAKAASSQGGAAVATGGPSGPAGTLTSFQGGLQSLPLALASRAPFAIEFGIAVHSIGHTATCTIEGPLHGAAVAPAPPRWAITLQGSGNPIFADAIILATEGWASARLLQRFAPEIATELAAIDYPAVSVVSLGYPPAAAARFPKGFGCLIPRGEAQRALGFLWDSQLFPHRAPSGHFLVRCLYGGALDPNLWTFPEEALQQLAQREIAALFGVQQPAEFQTTVRWDQAIPQYNLGHIARRTRVDQALAKRNESGPPIALAGNALHGVAFGKAAARGWQVGEHIVKALG